MSLASSPYTVRIHDPTGINPDAHLQLIEDLGGNANVAGIYVTTNGETGDQDDSLIVNLGVADEWQDYRGDVGFGPTIIFTGTAKPAYDDTPKELIPDAVDDHGVTAAVAAFNPTGDKAVVMVASFISGSYVGGLSDDAATDIGLLIEVDANWRVQVGINWPGPDSGVAANSTRRTIIGSKSGTHAKVTVPNQAQVTMVSGATNENMDLVLWRAFGTAGPVGFTKLKAVLVLNIDPDTTQRATIAAWAVSELGAVLA